MTQYEIDKKIKDFKTNTKIMNFASWCFMIASAGFIFGVCSWIFEYNLGGKIAGVSFVFIIVSSFVFKAFSNACDKAEKELEDL